MMTPIFIEVLFLYPFILLLAVGFVVYLVIKMVWEERAQTHVELMQPTTGTEEVWPPPPNDPAA